MQAAALKESTVQELGIIGEEERRTFQGTRPGEKHRSQAHSPWLNPGSNGERSLAQSLGHTGGGRLSRARGGRSNMRGVEEKCGVKYRKATGQAGGRMINNREFY